MTSFAATTRRIATFILGLALLGAGPAAFAATPHKVAIQMSSSDPELQGLALANALNARSELGADTVVELVAFGPGLNMLTAESPVAERVKTLAGQITFSACNNTIQAVTKRSGKAPVLVEGVKVVPSGVARLVELQEQGYAYLRP